MPSRALSAQANKQPRPAPNKESASPIETALPAKSCQKLLGDVRKLPGSASAGSAPRFVAAGLARRSMRRLGKDCTVRLRRVKGRVLCPRRNRSPAQICERIRPPIHRLSALSLASSLCNEQDGAAGCVYCRDHRRLATGRSISKHKVAVTLCGAADSLQLARLTGRSREERASETASALETSRRRQPSVR